MSSLAYDPKFIDALPPLKEVVHSYDLAPQKKLGQNFLYDANLTDKIVRSAGTLADKTVIEIGPGPGGLTRSILRAGVKKLYCIERDTRCLPALKILEEESNQTCQIINEDALSIDYSQLGSEPFAVIANLPYNISTTLLVHWLDHIELFDQFTLMFQKEVVERIHASPNTKDYGRLSVITQFLCQTRPVFHIPPEAFMPPPKVVSSVINIVPRKEVPSDVSWEGLKKICHITFGKRRKTLRNSLQQLTDSQTVTSLLDSIDIDPQKRPEVLDIDDFCKLTKAFSPYLS
ncbi:MAG: 16S rRNA (adenine(1518)-N(6)/adenine(1519)-N(6))-dimethyltransferase RsmA [Rickettsiales bacterium]|nr:16S rRNA (adenine(1518)-N(6)/adenine(1519)-N(6))-dimethyltransferase RsmA [Rickettsiales bacterium]